MSRKKRRRESLPIISLAARSPHLTRVRQNVGVASVETVFEPACCILSLGAAQSVWLINKPPKGFRRRTSAPGSTDSGNLQGQEEEQLDLAIIRGADCIPG